MKKNSLLIISVSLLFLFACTFSQNGNDVKFFNGKKIKGNKEVIKTSRSTKSFNKLCLDGSMDVTYIASPVLKIEIEGESNLIPYLETEVSKNILSIGFEKGLSIQCYKPIKVIIYSPELQNVKIDGSGDFYSKAIKTNDFSLIINGSGDADINLTVKELKLKINGSGDIKVKGQATKASCEIVGSGDIHTSELVQENCFVKIVGSGNAHVHANNNLDIKIIGSGDVYYSGNSTVKQNIIGSGDIIKR